MIYKQPHGKIAREAITKAQARAELARTYTAEQIEHILAILAEGFVLETDRGVYSMGG